jgi:hypothetical protein
MNSVARHIRIAATVKLLELDALSAARVASVTSPDDEGGAVRACPAPPLPPDHVRLRAMLLRMLGVRGVP